MLFFDSISKDSTKFKKYSKILSKVSHAAIAGGDNFEVVSIFVYVRHSCSVKIHSWSFNTFHPNHKLLDEN